MTDILLLAGIAVFVLGIIKRRQRWGVGAMVAGVMLVALGFLLGGGEDLKRGFRDGYRDGKTM